MSDAIKIRITFIYKTVNGRAWNFWDSRISHLTIMQHCIISIHSFPSCLCLHFVISLLLVFPFFHLQLSLFFLWEKCLFCWNKTPKKSTESHEFFLSHFIVLMWRFLLLFQKSRECKSREFNKLKYVKSFGSGSGKISQRNLLKMTWLFTY